MYLSMTRTSRNKLCTFLNGSFYGSTHFPPQTIQFKIIFFYLITDLIN